METLPTIRISLPGRRCRCGALREGTNHRCRKCQARAGWYRHNCRAPRRRTSRAAHAAPNPGASQQPTAIARPAAEGR